MDKEGELKVRVRSGDKEIETSIPWSVRTAPVSVGSDSSSPKGMLDMVTEMVVQLNNIK